MLRPITNAWAIAGLSAIVLGTAGCPDVASFHGDDLFQHEAHSLLPPAPSPYEEGAPAWQIATGVTTGEAPAQPVAFPHARHVTDMGIQCEYCHVTARRSIHAGVPSTATCMNCHKYVKKDSPEIQKVWASFNTNTPLQWSKVHDLPDYVYFAHNRHVNAGVQCTECHGQVGQQGQLSKWNETDANGATVEHVGAKSPMIRETSLQMGWCLDCHATHPSIDTNYGDQANLRRAELKDCWTCHK